jgi:ABC-2 type transport system ATP-binding protein
MEQCGLTDVSHRIIGQLSMGYRQRVGLADALVHEPQLIILDEPTLGLDPNQIRAVRTLIKKLGGQHTVLISTHILPEVEMTCNRVLILHQGRILASDTPMNLQAVLSQSGQIIAEIKAPKSELIDFFSDFEPLESYEISTSEVDYFRCTLIPSTSIDLRPLIFEEVCTRKWALRELSGCRPTLEDVFVHMTRTKLEEE